MRATAVRVVLLEELRERHHARMSDHGVGRDRETEPGLVPAIAEVAVLRGSKREPSAESADRIERLTRTRDVR